MILPLAHTKLNVYLIANDLALECYNLVKLLPMEERFNLVQQIKRASISVVLNIAEGASRKSILERKRFFEIARGSLVEVDTAINLCVCLNYLKSEDLVQLTGMMIKVYSMLSRMIG